MFWLILCIGIAATYALSAILDNYLIDVFYKNKNAEAIKAINSPFYFALGIIMIAPFGIHINSPITALIAAGSGALISLASIPYIRALKNEEATTASIFYQLQPLIFLLIDVSILQKAITGNDMLGFIITLLAPIVVIVSARRKGHRIDFSSAILFILYDIFAVASSAIFAYLGKNNDAWTIYGFYILPHTPHSELAQARQVRAQALWHAAAADSGLKPDYLYRRRFPDALCLYDCTNLAFVCRYKCSGVNFYLPARNYFDDILAEAGSRKTQSSYDYCTRDRGLFGGYWHYYLKLI